MKTEKEKIATSERIANQLAGKNPNTVAGAARAAREKLIQAEKDLGKELDLYDKLNNADIHVTYQGEEAVIPQGKVLFNSVLLTSDRKGIRPVEKTKVKTVHSSTVFDVQTVVKVGPHVSELEVGDKVLINVDQFLQRNVRPPSLLLPTELGDTREYLTLSERDIKYIY
tara:strand:+ start:135 stop:641 length:507 start_codon:yes stop_codon:yes gene_type:complete